MIRYIRFFCRKVVYMRNRWRFVICICFFIFLAQLLLANQIVVAKERPKEKVYCFDDQQWVIRRDYGLIAKNVSSVKIGSYSNFWAVFLEQKGEKKVKEVDLFHKKKGVSTSYKMNTVFKKAKSYYPMIDRSLYVDKKNRLLFTGKDKCYMFAEHVTEKACKKSFGKYRNEVVQQKVHGSKCWCDSDMFAYVKNNSLYITGSAVAPPTNYECYKNETVKTFFQGEGNKIKEVICGQCDGYGHGNIFVLMNDGSVWGMGNNKCKMVSKTEQKYYNDFIKIIPKGVKMVAANSQNVAIIKNNDSLYTWGKTLKSRKKQYSFKPKKIADNVKEVSMSDSEFEGDTVLVYLKKRGTAYGLGENADYAFTERYKKGWNSKSVLLRKKIKHVYASPRATILLDKKGKLYWTGTQDYYGQYDWVYGNEKNR